MIADKQSYELKQTAIAFCLGAHIVLFGLTPATVVAERSVEAETASVGHNTSSLSIKLFLRKLERAKKGEKDAQYAVGERYEKGKGVAANMEQALIWYRHAAEQEYKPALRRIAKWQKEQEKTQKTQKAQKARMATEAQRKQREAAEAKRHTEEMQRIKVAQVEKTQAANQAREQALRIAREKMRKENEQRAAFSQDKMANMLLNNNWRYNNVALEFMSSSLASCSRLGTQGSIACFTEKIKRDVGSSRLIYTVRSDVTLADPQYFNIRYQFRVLKIKRGGAGSLSDLPQPQEVEGEQAPEISLDCMFEKVGQVSCSRENGQSYVFTADG